MTGNGDMPLSNRNRTHWISFNGEIYNHSELREEMRRAGICFASQSDSEVVLNGFAHYGDQFIQKLNGIFAGVIYDAHTNTAFAFRDRFGSKPLFYTTVGKCTWFSSEFNTLIDIRSTANLEIDSQALTAYMICRFVPGSKTILQDISKVAPAELHRIDLSRRVHSKHVFWNARIAPRSFDQEEFDFRLTNCINRTAVCDTGVDVLLSSGVDSLAVATVLAERNKETISYTCRSHNSHRSISSTPQLTLSGVSYDESADARMLSHKLGLKNVTVVVDEDLTEASFVEMLRVMGEPIASTNAIANYLLAKQLSGKTRCVLTGTGSDELLGGYESLYFKKQGAHRTADLALMEAFSDFDNGLQRPLSFLSSSYLETDYLAEHLRSVMESSLDTDDEALNALSLFELGFALPGWELDQSDRLFMQETIEVRAGFLENEFVDYALTIPSVEKRNKAPLRRYLSKYFPKETAFRQKYAGMGASAHTFQNQWFKAGISKLLERPLPIWNQEKILMIRDSQFESLGFDVLNRLIVFQLWHEAIFSTN